MAQRLFRGRQEVGGKEVLHGVAAPPQGGYDCMYKAIATSIRATLTQAATSPRLLDPVEIINEKRAWGQRAQQAPNPIPTDHLYENFVVVGLPHTLDVKSVSSSIKTYSRLRGSGHNLRGLEVRPESSREARGHVQHGLRGPHLPPSVLHCSPPGMDASLAATIPELCFPNGVRPALLERTPSMSELAEVVCGRAHLSSDAHAFVFALRVTTGSSAVPRTLWGVCCCMRELVHRPPALLADHESGSPTLPRYLVTAPRCYCLLTYYPFFSLHFRVLQTVLGLERLDTMTLMANNLATEEERPSTPDVSSSSSRSQSAGDNKMPAVSAVYTGSGERSARSITLSCLAGAERMGGVRRALDAALEGGLSRDEPQQKGKANALKEEKRTCSQASNPKGSPAAAETTTILDTSRISEIYAQHVEEDGSAVMIADATAVCGTVDGQTTEPVTSKQADSSSQTHSDEQPGLVRRQDSSQTEQKVVTNANLGDRNGAEQPELATLQLSHESAKRIDQHDDNLAEESTTPPRQSEGEQLSSPILVTALSSFQHRTRQRTGSSGDAGSNAESYTSALSSLRGAAVRGTPGGRRTPTTEMNLEEDLPVPDDDASSVTSSYDGTSVPEEEEESSETAVLTPQRLPKAKESPRSLHRAQDSTATDLSSAVTPVRPVLARADVFSPQPRGVLAHMNDASEEDGSCCELPPLRVQGQLSNPHAVTSRDVLEVYHSAPIPNFGQELVFSPDDALQPISYQRSALARAWRASGLHGPLATAGVDLEAAENLGGWAIPALCRCMSLDGILTYLSAALQEAPTVVFCPNLGLLSAVVLSLIPMLLPFGWQSLLLPVMPAPAKRLELLDAPVPFVVGVQYKTPEVSSRCHGLVRVNVYKDKISNAGHLAPLPNSNLLREALAGTYSELRTLGQSTGASHRPVHEVSDAQVALAGVFLSTIQTYLRGLVADLHTYTITDVSASSQRTSILLKEPFVEASESQARPFMAALCETQLFAVYCDAVLAQDN